MRISKRLVYRVHEALSFEVLRIQRVPIKKYIIVFMHLFIKIKIFKVVKDYLKLFEKIDCEIIEKFFLRHFQLLDVPIN